MGLNVADAALGIGTYVAQGAGDLIFGQFRQNQQLKGQRKALEQQNAAAYDLWKKTSYPAQMEQLKKAGLNPGLLYGMGGSGGGTLGGSNAMPDAAPTGMGILQGQMLAAQIENIKADTAQKQAEAAYKSGVQTQKGWIDIEAVKQQISSDKSRQALTEVETELAKIAQYYEGKTVEDRISKVNVELVTALNKLKIIENDADISTSTKDSVITATRLKVAEMLLGMEATRQGISESKSRQTLMSEQGRMYLAQIQQGYDNIATGNRNAGTAEQRLMLDKRIQEFSEFTGIGVDVIKTVLGAGILKGAFTPGRTVVQGFK